MSILGKYTKQPVEVEIYSIQFAEDLTETDEITGAWQIYAPLTFPAWDQVVQDAPYTATTADDGTILGATASITLPTGVSDGYRLCVANVSQSAAISVGATSVPARGSIVVLRSGGAWVTEAKANSTLVDAPADQRVRTQVFAGTDRTTYKAQVAVVTAEGRTLQDEFIVKIKEV